MTEAELAAKAEDLVRRAKIHGVDLVPGEHMISVVEKMVDRMDKYKAEGGKPRLIV